MWCVCVCVDLVKIILNSQSDSGTNYLKQNKMKWNINVYELLVYKFHMKDIADFLMRKTTWPIFSSRSLVFGLDDD